MNEQRKKKSAFAMICLIAMLLLVSLSALPNDETQQLETAPETVTFVLSTWTYPDSYGQGIESIEVLGNSTGSWVEEATIQNDDSEADATVEWGVGVGIRIEVYTFLNSTLVGCSSRPEGQLYHRHYLIVKDSSDTTIFSQQNFTYQYSDADNYPLYFYQYRVEPDFLPIIGEVYTFEFMYEIYY